MTLVVSSAATVDRPVPSEQRPALVYLASLSAGSRPAMLRALGRAIETVTGGPLTGEAVDAVSAFPWHTLRYQHTQAIRAHLVERHSPATVNQTLAALRGVLKEAWRLGLLTGEDYHRAVDLRSVRVSRLSQATGRAATVGELRALFVACAGDPTPAGRRDAAILAMQASTGLRCGELVALKLDDWSPEEGRVDVLRGKGGKARSVYLNGSARAALDAWFRIRGDQPGPLFNRIRRGGHVQPSGITTQAVVDLLARRCNEASVDRLRPHDLRRTVASELLDAGADVGTVSKILGHASADVTLSYDRRPETVKRSAADLLHVPYVEPSPLTPTP